MLREVDEVRRALEDMAKRLKEGETATIEVSEGVLEFTVDEAIRRRLSVVDAYEKDDFIVVAIVKRHR